MDDNFLLTAFMPHPPVAIDEIGGSESLKVKNTAQSMTKLADKIVSLNPELIILITPHSQKFSGSLGVYCDEKLKGNFTKFGAYNARVIFRNDLEFINTLEKNKKLGKLNKISEPVSIDHGASVPLYFLSKAGYKGKVVIFNNSMLKNYDQLHFGKIIRDTVIETSKKTVFIASGDLSHKISPSAPAGYNPLAKDFDQYILENIETGDYDAILDIEENKPGLRTIAGECGYNPLVIAIGYLDNQPQANSVFSYEAPFGVGYLVATL